MVLAAVVLFCFYRLERWKERHDRSPLFEFGQLRHRGFRYGLITTSVLAMGQLGMFFVLPIYLQDAKHLSAETNGLWMVPAGVFIIVGSQIGGRLVRHVGVTRVVQLGLVLEVIGIVVIAFVVSPSVTFPDLLLGWGLFGFGIGFASSQLTNVILSDIPDEKSGVASGTNSTVRQVGAALGVAVIGSVFASLTVSKTVAAVRATKLPAALQSTATARIHSQGAGFPVPRGHGSGRCRHAEPRARHRPHRRRPARDPRGRRVRHPRRVPVVAAAPHRRRPTGGTTRRAARGPRTGGAGPFSRRRARACLTGQPARPRMRTTSISMATRAGFGCGSR